GQPGRSRTDRRTVSVGSRQDQAQQTGGTTMSQPPYQVTNPATGEVVEKFDFATDAEIEAAMASAASAHTEWSARPIEERAAIVKKVAALFKERQDELGRLISLEMGKAAADAAGEAEYFGDICDYYADNGPALLESRPVPGNDNARVEYRSIGAVLGI